MAGDALALSCGADWVVNVVPIACGSMDKAFRLQHTVPFRQASLFVFIARRTHEPLLNSRSNVSPPPPIKDGMLSNSYRSTQHQNKLSTSLDWHSHENPLHQNLSYWIWSLLSYVFKAPSSSNIVSLLSVYISNYEFLFIWCVRMLDDFSTELENTESRLDTVMKKMAKVTRMSNGKRNSKYIVPCCIKS